MDKSESDPCHAALSCSLSCCLCHSVFYTGIKCCRKDVIRIQLFIAYQTRDRISRCNFHLIIDVGCAHVESSAEDTREAKHVVNLVREIASSGRYDCCSCRFRLIREDLRRRVCACEIRLLLLPLSPHPGRSPASGLRMRR